MNKLFKILFFSLIVKPVVLVVLGLNIKGRNNLPHKGPAVIAANHNSHLDTIVLMSLFPLTQVNRNRPVAAADYFFRNKFIKWLSLNIIGIIPLDRSGNSDRDSLFTECHDALDKGEILLIFPEGSRGRPEEMSRLKKGLYYLIKDREDNTNITPVMMHGLGRALPKGEALLVPFNCDVIVGEPLNNTANSVELIAELTKRYDNMAKLCLTRRP